METSTYPGMEKEQATPNTDAQPQRHCWPPRTLVISPLAGRQTKPGTSSRAATSMEVLQPSAHGLFGTCPAPPSPSAWADAGAAEPTLSALHPADSGFTVEGPMRKRPRLAQGRSSGLLSAAGSWAVTSGAADSDSDDEEEAVSRKRPTPGKATAAPTNTGAALTAVAPPAAPQRVRVLAQHPPPTWAASLRSSAGVSACAAPSCAHHQHASQACTEAPAEGEAGSDTDEEWSDMEEDNCGVWGQPTGEWQRVPLPLPLDVEE